jgi:glycosyltransferase involved in cell wall biosynthesis
VGDVSNKPTLSIVIPCLNEEKTIGLVVQDALIGLAKLGIKGEILVVDNASSDESRVIAVQYGAVVVQANRKGYGEALMAGINAAQGEWVCIADADYSYDLSDLNLFRDSITNGADLVVGNRFAGGIEKGAMPFLNRYVGNPILSQLGRFLFNSKIKDFHCGMRAFSKTSIQALNLHASGMEFASEMILKAELSGLQVEQVAIKFRKDKRDRKPHLHRWRDGLKHLLFMLAYNPKMLFLIPGIGIFLSSSLALGRLYFGDIGYRNTLFSSGTMIAFAISALVGAQMIWFGILSKFVLMSKNLIVNQQTWLELRNIVSSIYFPLMSAFLFLVGFVLEILAIKTWAQNDFGPLVPQEVVRNSVIALFLMVLGIQNVLGHFLSSLITIRTLID